MDGVTQPEGLDAQVAKLIADAEAFLRSSAGTSAHAVKVSSWEVRLYRETRDSHGPLSQVAAGFDEDVDYSEDLLADVFAYLWLSAPQVLPRSEVLATRWDNQHVLTCMSRSVEVQELRSATVHDETAAAMAVVWLSESIRKWLKEQDDPTRQQDTRQQVEQALETLRDALASHEPINDDQEALADVVQALGEALEDADHAGGSIEGLDTAARDAAIEFDELQGLAGALGLSARGDATGEGRSISSGQMWALLRRLRASQISAYADLIGRMTSLALSGTSRSLIPRGVDLSDRLWDADASELATRRHPLLRLEHLERVAAGELITDAYTGKPEVAGPMVILVDESSSMELKNQDIPRSVWAKAFALAMVQQARKARRKAVVISFSSPKQVKTWENVVEDPEELVSFLEHDWFGGTSYEEPLDAALTVVERFPGMRSADIVLVTDDDRVDVPAGWLTRWRQRRDLVKPVPPKLRGVGVGTRVGQWLSKAADDVVLIDDFTSEQQVVRATRRL